MSEFSAHFDVFSPRWGHTDRYSVKFTAAEMYISQGNFSAVCKLAENGDLEWTGYNAGTGNPLMKIFSHDSIYAPEIVPFALGWAWERWQEGSTDESVIQEGLKELFSWVDQTARSKPSSKLWQGAF